MADRPRLALFCEDRGHEQLVRALVERLAKELRVRPTVHAPSARGGHGRAVAEFKLWQRSLAASTPWEVPDLLVLTIDANCSG